MIIYIWMNKWVDSLHQNCSWEIIALSAFSAVKFSFWGLILVLSVFVYLSLISETCPCLSQSVTETSQCLSVWSLRPASCHASGRQNTGHIAEVAHWDLVLLSPPGGWMASKDRHHRAAFSGYPSLYCKYDPFLRVSGHKKLGGVCFHVQSLIIFLICENMYKNYI